MPAKRVFITVSLTPNSREITIKDYLKLQAQAPGQEKVLVMKALQAFYLPLALLEENYDVNDTEITKAGVDAFWYLTNQLIVIRNAMEAKGIATDFLDGYVKAMLPVLTEKFDSDRTTNPEIKQIPAKNAEPDSETGKRGGHYILDFDS